MGTTPETQFAQSGDLSIAYQDVGTGPPDLVGVPGFQSHVELGWDYSFARPLLEHFSSYGRLVFFDKRGSGLSDRWLGTGTLEDRMDDVHAVMDAAGLERAALIGVSNGGALAAQFAAANPERVSALVLYLAGIQSGVDADFERVLDLIHETWNTGLVMNEVVGHPPDPVAALTQLARYERYSSSPADCVEILRRSREIDVTPFLPMITAPTLVINHRDDPLMPPHLADPFVELIPGATRAIVDGDVHLSWRPSDYDEPLRLIKAFLTGTPEEPVSTHRMLTTVLFTDIVRSTDHAASVGDASWRRLLDRHDEISLEEVNRNGGVLVKHTGDGTLAHFDSPGRAVTCALTISERVEAIGLRTRAGVHTGEVERRGDDLGGIAVNLAARVMDHAGPGEVLTSRTVKDLTIGGGLTFDERGLHELRGVPDRWALFAVQ